MGRSLVLPKTDWDDEKDLRLVTLWNDGHSLNEIGRRMGITRNAVAGRKDKLKDRYTFVDKKPAIPGRWDHLEQFKKAAEPLPAPEPAKPENEVLALVDDQVLSRIGDRLVKKLYGIGHDLISLNMRRNVRDDLAADYRNFKDPGIAPADKARSQSRLHELNELLEWDHKKNLRRGGLPPKIDITITAPPEQSAKPAKPQVA